MDILSPKLGAIYNLGQTITIDWEEWRKKGYTSGVLADRYTIRVINNGVLVVNHTYNDGGATSTNYPQSYHNFTITCDRPGGYLIEVIAYEAKNNILGTRSFSERCRRYSAFGVSPVPPAPQPQAHVVCQPGDYIVTVNNPSNAEFLRFYESAADLPNNNYSYHKDANNNFKITVPIVDNVKAFFITFYNPNASCSDKESPKSPIAIGYINLSSLSANTSDTVNIAPSSSCDIPGTFHPLSANIIAVNTVIKQQIDFLNALEPDLVDAAVVDVRSQWEPQQYITDYMLNDSLLGEKVCNSDLPIGYGTSRTYTRNFSYKFAIKAMSVDGLQVDEEVKACDVPLLTKVTVSKALPVPDPDIIVLCKQGSQAARYAKPTGLPSNTILEWYTTPIGGTNVNPSFGPFNNFGFSYFQNYQATQNLSYTYYVGYRIGNKRSPSRSVVRIIVVPDVPQVANNYEVTKPTDPNNPNEAGTFIILNQDVSAYVAYFNSLLTNIPSTAPVKVACQVAADWTPRSNGEITYQLVTDPITGRSTIQYRVYQHNLPALGGSCRTYTNDIVLSFVIKRYDPVFGDTISKVKTCNFTSQTATVCKAMIAPEPTVHLFCKPGEWDIKYENPDNYPNMRWYNTITGGDTLSDEPSIRQYADGDKNSFTFQDNFNTGHRILYVSHVSSSGRESGRAQVLTITLPGFNYGGEIEVYTVRKPAIAAANDRDAYCTSDNPEPLTFHDLDVDISEYEAQVRSVLRGLPVSVRARDTLITVEWSPAQFISHPGLNNNINRVCYGDLPEGEESNRLYEAKLKVHFEIDVKDNPAVSQGFINIPITGPTCDMVIRKVNVVKAPPVAGGPVKTCEANFDDPSNAQQYVNCQTVERVAICPNDTYTMGPQSPDVPGNTYRWSPAEGLSNTTVKNPILSYAGLTTLAKGSYRKYTLTISNVSAPSNQIHCAMVYKCNACEGARAANEDAEQPNRVQSLVNSEQFSLYPNPTHSDVHIVYTSQSGTVEDAKALVYDRMGRLVWAQALASGVAEQVLNTDNLLPGTYYCTVQQGNSFSKRLPLVIVR